MTPTLYLKAVARWVGGVALGTILWGIWVLLWRGAEWPILAAGAAFPLATLAAVGVRALGLDFPVSPWIRLDLWLLFAAVMVALVTRAVVRTAWSILTGGVSPGIVAIPVRLRSEMGQLLFMWAITVTPGTIALLVEGDMAYVHCLHRPSGPHLRELSAVERLLGKLWG